MIDWMMIMDSTLYMDIARAIQHSESRMARWEPEALMSEYISEV